MTIRPACATDRADIDHLLDHAFGPDRHGRTAYRLRGGVSPIDGLSLVAHEGGALIGSIQCWPIDLVCDQSGDRRWMTLLGPVAVLPERQGTGLGTRLMDRTLAAADAAGHDAILLIGDADYYGRFGFTADATGSWTLPGPVEWHRLLARIAPGVTLFGPAHVQPLSGRSRAAA